MGATIIDGKQIAKSMRERIVSSVNQLKEENVVPGLVVILVGDDPASHSYVKGKAKACRELGIHNKLIHLPIDTSENELLNMVEQYNNDSNFHGILVQLPLPDHISEQKVIETISPNKDVDGFHPYNIGRMMTKQNTFLSCTPFGILHLLKYLEIDIQGQNAVVIGRSNIVGKPVGQLLLNENATVTYCHSKTKDLTAFTKRADILIVAVGQHHLIKKEHVKEGAVVIDVGMNRVDGKLEGDVDFDTVKEVASYITPVPGGVGPMTITMLLYNTVKSAIIKSSSKVSI